MKRRLSNLALSALTIAAVSGLTVLRTGLAVAAGLHPPHREHLSGQ